MYEWTNFRKTKRFEVTAQVKKLLKLELALVGKRDVCPEIHRNYMRKKRLTVAL